MFFYIFILPLGQALVAAVTSGDKRFFLGTDSAPHERQRKECACGCAGIYNSPVALSIYARVFEKVTNKKVHNFLLLPDMVFGKETGVRLQPPDPEILK